MRIPDLFIVGAAKSGTTSMEKYLAAHPDVFMAPRSEMHHFGSDLDFRYRVSDRAQYLAQFAEAGSAVAAGEKSVGYLFSAAAANEIHEFNRAARIVVMLRNPVDMLFSLHRQFVRSGNEDLVQFEEALAAQEDRRQGKRLPPTVHKPDMLQYFEVVRYADQVERYLRVFGGNVLVLLFEDFKANPAGAYSDVLRHIGADPDFRPDFSVHNQTIDLPSVGLRRQMARFPGAASTFRRLTPRDMRRRLRRASAVFQQQPSRELAHETRRGLQARFEPEIDALEQLLGRDLESWRSH